MITSPYIIRPATVADLATIRAISIEIFDYTFRHQNNRADFETYMQQAFNEKQLEQELASEVCVFFLIFEDSKDIAYAKLGRGNTEKGLEGTKNIEIERFYVRQEYQGKGVAQLMMDHCLQIATEEGFETVWLGVWEHNPKAARFYEKSGFRTFGSHDFWVGNDCQTDNLMKRQLP